MDNNNFSEDVIKNLISLSSESIRLEVYEELNANISVLTYINFYTNEIKEYVNDESRTNKDLKKSFDVTALFYDMTMDLWNNMAEAVQRLGINALGENDNVDSDTIKMVHGLLKHINANEGPGAGEIFPIGKQ